MFEFLAKVSAKYGQGATLPEAAASELDSAAKRTRQLDQAALDLEGKQREAELTAKKELVSQEEKKAAAATKAKEKAQDNLLKYFEIVSKNKGKVIPFKLTSSKNIDTYGPLVKDIITDALDTRNPNFKPPVLINDEGQQLTGKKLKDAISSFSNDSQFQGLVLSNLEQISAQAAQDGFSLNQNDLFTQAINKSFTELPIKLKERGFFQKQIDKFLK